MHTSTPAQARDARWYRWIAGGFWTLAASVFIILGLIALESREAAWNRAALTCSNLANTFAANIAQMVGTFDLSLRASQRAFQSPTLSSADFAAQRQMLFDGAVDPRHLGSVFITTADGTVVHDTTRSLPVWDTLADRDYFQVQRDDPGVGLFISKPYLSKLSGQYSLALSRRLAHEDGSFAGIVAGTVRFSFLDDLFSQIGWADSGAIRLFRIDGTLIAGTGLSPHEIGADFSRATLFQQRGFGQDKPFDANSAFDGQRKLFAVKQLANAPLIVAVNMPLSSVYRDWMQKTLINYGVCGLLFAAAFLLLQIVRRQSERSAATQRTMLQNMAMFSAYFSNATDALFVVRVTGDSLRYEAINPACERLTGFSMAKLQGRTIAEGLPPHMADAVEQRYRTCIASGEPYIYSEQRDLPAGTRHWHTILAPVKDEHGTTILLLGNARDMTNEKRMVAEYMQAGKMEAVGRLTAGLAHDFNNSLQKIIGNLELLEGCATATPDDSESWGVALAAAQDSAKLVQHLVAFSRQQVLRPERVAVPAALAAACGLVRPTLGDDVRVEIVVQPLTGALTVDPAQLERCLVSLMLNARDAMPRGGDIRIRARNSASGEERFGQLGDGDFVVISVTDSGPGMAADVAARAFDPFFTTKGFGSSAGLGLASVQGTCRQSGGDARILSHAATGTRVELWLPRTAADEAARDASPLPDGRTGRLLLVGPGKDEAAGVGATLVGNGFELVMVCTGLAGLSRLGDDTPYDLIVFCHNTADIPLARFIAVAGTLRPGTPVLLAAGTAQGGTSGPILSGVSIVPVVAEPEAILEAVRRALRTTPRQPQWVA